MILRLIHFSHFYQHCNHLGSPQQSLCGIFAIISQCNHDDYNNLFCCDYFRLQSCCSFMGLTHIYLYLHPPCVHLFSSCRNRNDNLMTRQAGLSSRSPGEHLTAFLYYLVIVCISVFDTTTEICSIHFNLMIICPLKLLKLGKCQTLLLVGIFIHRFFV